MAGRRDAGSGMCEVAVGDGNGSWNRQWEEAVAVGSGSGSMKWQWQWKVAMAVESGNGSGKWQ